MKIKSTFLTIILSLIVLLGCARDQNESAGNNCGMVNNVTFQSFATNVSLNFGAGTNANSFKIEYGVSGFLAGTGKSITTSNNYVVIQDLNPATTYDFYITGICSSSQTSAPYKLSSVTTQPSNCKGTTSAQFFQYEANEMIMQIGYSGGAFSYHEVEFGPTGFVFGSGTRIKGEKGVNNLYFNNLQLGQSYDFYVRTYCSEGDANTFKKFTYTAAVACPKPFNLNSYIISGACNVGMGATRGFSWSSYGSPQSYTISLIQNVNGPPSSQTFTTSNTSIAISNMYCDWKGFYVRANCANGTSGDWAGPFIF